MIRTFSMIRYLSITFAGTSGLVLGFFGDQWHGILATVCFLIASVILSSMADEELIRKNKNDQH